VKLKLFLPTIIIVGAITIAQCQNYPPIPLHKENNKTIIPVCTSFPLVGDSSIIGRQLLAGFENYLREYKHFTAESTTDYKRSFAIKHLANNKLTNDKGVAAIKEILPQTPLILGLAGAETFISLLPLIKQNNLLLLFPLEGDPWLRSMKLENVIYFRPSYEKELKALAHYAITLKHKSSIAIFYEASTWGKNVCELLKKILTETYSITPVAIAPYAQGTIEIDESLKKIAQSTPNVIFCLGQPRPAYQFISNALNVGLHECLFLGLSQLSVIQKLLKTSRGLDIAVTSVVPNTRESKIPIVQEYKETIKTFLSFRDDSPFYLETFITLSIFEHILKRTNTPITIPEIITALESFKDFKGLSISFNADDRSLSSALWINPGMDQPWLEVK
jgi:ABC-type branched-subunit amino acid transport system substrate-binding protein